MMVRALCRDFGPRHILPRRDYVVRPPGSPCPETRSIVAAAISRSIENRPRPPFSLSGTVSYVAYSRSFYHFAAGELLQALLLRSRREWSHLYPPRFDLDGGFECCPCVKVGPQVNRIARRVLEEIPTTDAGVQGNAVGTRLNLLA